MFLNLSFKEALSVKISARQVGHSDFLKKKDDIRQKLDSIVKPIEALESERKKLMSSIEECQKTGREAVSKSRISYLMSGNKI